MGFVALQCCDCHYYQTIPSSPEGPCNRYPVATRVKANYWCGEWKQKEMT